MKYARIDGTYSLSQRQKILEDYHTDNDTRILLMTTGTGAVGYKIHQGLHDWTEPADSFQQTQPYNSKLCIYFRATMESNGRESSDWSGSKTWTDEERESRAL